MENDNGDLKKRWRFKGTERVTKASGLMVRVILNKVMENVRLDDEDDRQVLRFGHGDPSAFPAFGTSHAAMDAIIQSLSSFQFNCYSPPVGLLSARKAVAEYLSPELPYKLSADDVFITVGGSQAIEIALSALSRPGANVLLPRPGFPMYEANCACIGLQVRHFNLIPEKEWEVDLDAVQAIADENTVAMVIINPGNPCGTVYSYEHLQQVAETARKLGILVIADEVYGHLTFGTNPFVPMGVFASVVPVLTIGSISKRWIVPGWRLGWLVTNDTQAILQKTGVVDSLKGFLNISSDPATFIQGGLPEILEKTKGDFFSKITDLLHQGADICYEKLQEIPCITCPHKPNGSMFMMVKLNLALLDDIVDDYDFCIKLAKEEKTVILPGVAVGLKNWLRMTFAMEPSSLKEALQRIKAFCQRHSKRELKIVGNGW